MSSWFEPLLIQLSATCNQMHSWYKSQHSQYFISVWHITFFKILTYPWPSSILPTILKENSAIIIISHFINIETRILREFSSVQFSSVAQSCPILCDPMNCSMPDLPVHYQLPEFTQTHVHWVSDAIQPSHPLSSPSPSAPNPSQISLVWKKQKEPRLKQIQDSSL